VDLTWIIVIGLVAGILIGWAIGASRGRPLLGAVLGVFGLVGWIVILLVPRPGPYSGAVDVGPLEHHDPHRPEHLADGTLPRSPND